jgi:phosphoribosyl-dephospho-CoA transferase
VDLAAQPHDLLEVQSLAQLLATPTTLVAPEWVAGALRRAPFVVVRRAPARAGWLPVGIRGVTREQRWATVLPASAVARHITPPELSRRAIELAGDPDLKPLALQTLERLAPLLHQTGLLWGPAGSTAFELATGQPTLSSTSDLDLVLYTPTPLKVTAATQLLVLVQLEAVALTRLDVQLQTPVGGVALLEFVRGSQVMVKTATGPVLRTVQCLWE